MRLVLSPSSLAAFLRCPQLYYWSRVQRLTTKVVSQPRIEGRAFHSFLEAHLSGLGREIALAKIREIESEIDKSTLSASALESIDRGLMRVRAMAEGYAEAYRDDATQWPTQLVERAAEVTVAQVDEHEVVLQGRIDRLAKDRDGNWWIVESKTRSRELDPDAIAALAWDNQLIAYHILAEQIVGTAPAGVVYDTVIKTQHRQTAKETPSAFESRLRDIYLQDATHRPMTLYRREPVTLQPAALDAYRKRVAFSANSVLTLMASDATVWPRNTEACVNHYGACDYLEVCASGVPSTILGQQ